MRIALRFGLVVVAGLSLAACESGAMKGSAVTRVASTTSFGMCAGYCKTTLEITEGKAVLVSEAWGRGAGANLPKRTVSTVLSAQEWQDIANAAAAAKIDALPDTIGCPDCADGGAESLTIESPGHAKTINFDHGADIKEAQPLLQKVRALREVLVKKEP